MPFRRGVGGDTRISAGEKQRARSHRSVNTAKLFWSGRSQAVRLCKVCNLDGEPVRMIRRHGAAVILGPVAAGCAWLEELHGTLDVDAVHRANVGLYVTIR